MVPHLIMRIASKMLNVAAKNNLDFLVWEGKTGARRRRAICILWAVGTRIRKSGVPGAVVVLLITHRLTGC